MYAWIICMHMWGCMHNVYVCVYSYICMYMGVYLCVCTCGVHIWVCYVCLLIPLSLYMIMIQRYRPVWWDPDPLQKSQNCVCCGPDTLAIEDWPTGRFRDPYRFVQWRPDDDSDLKSHHLNVCSCAIFLFTVVTGYLCFIHIISFDRLIYFTSMITCIISCDTSECSLWLYNLSEC